MQFIKDAGIVGIPLIILTLVVAGLVVRALLVMRSGDASGTVFAVLFWGFVAAVLGFLGQCAGLYNALTAISRATELDPVIIGQGFAQSFTTTLWGTGLLLVSGLAWLLLRTRNQRTAGTRA